MFDGIILGPLVKQLNDRRFKGLPLIGIVILLNACVQGKLKIGFRKAPGSMLVASHVNALLTGKHHLTEAASQQTFPTLPVSEFPLHHVLGMRSMSGSSGKTGHLQNELIFLLNAWD